MASSHAPPRPPRPEAIHLPWGPLDGDDGFPHRWDSNSMYELSLHGTCTKDQYDEPSRAASIRDTRDPRDTSLDKRDDWKPTGHELLVIITLAVTNLLVSLDASIIVTSLQAITTALGGNTTEGFWIGTSYLLVNAVVMPIIASLSDIFGRSVCLTFSLAMFTIGTVFCCTATNIPLMLIGRSIQGVGGGGVHVLGGVIMTDIVPLRHRPKWFGVVLGAWALGLCLGPIIGGLIAERTTWRWVFYLMFPICAYGLVSVPMLLTLQPRTATVREKLLRVDWIGAVLFMASATTFLVAISRAGSQQAWDSAGTIVPLLVGAAGIAATLVWDLYFAREPLFRPSLFCNTSSTVSYICGAAQGLLMWGLFYYLPFYFLSVKGLRPLDTGVSLLPLTLTVIPGSIITGRLVTRFRSYLGFVWAGWLIASLGSALMVTWAYVDNTTAVWVVTYLISGLGHGMVLNAGNFSTQAMCQPGDEAAAAAMYLFLRQLGAAIGVGVGGSTFQNVMALKLGWEGLPRAIAENAEGFIEHLLAMPDDDDSKARILAAYVFGFSAVFQLYLGVAIVALVLSLVFVKHFSIDKELVTDHTLYQSKASKLLVGKSTASSSWHASSGDNTP